MSKKNRQHNGQEKKGKKTNKFNSFWRDVILPYASIRDNPSTAPEEILSQPLWLNSEIKIGGKAVLYQYWAKANAFFLLMFY